MESILSKFPDIEKMICNKCKHSLSVPPIIHTDSTGIICGRCNHHAYKENSNPTIDRQVFLEEISKDMEFSCMYEDFGCKMKLIWDNVIEHEASCAHNIIPCISFFELFGEIDSTECEWEGPVVQFFEHVRKNHAEMIANSPHKLPLDNMGNCFMFIEYLGNLVLFVFLYDDYEDECFFIAMSDLVNGEKIPSGYQIKIIDDQGTSFCLPQTEIKNLVINSEIIKRKGVKFDISNIPSILNPKFLMFDLVTEKMENSHDSNIVKTDNFRLSAPLCAYNKCSLKYLTPPVYFCSKKHNVCADCLKKYPTLCCNKNSARNYALERILCSPIFKCENLNCSFVCSSSDYGLHQIICQFRVKKCPLENCQWSGQDLMLHVNESHVVSKLNCLIQLTENAQTFLFVFDERVFALKKNFTLEINDTSISTNANFQLICLDTKTFSYKYEIEICCPNIPHSKIMFQQIVEPEHLPIMKIYEQKNLILEKILEQLFPLEKLGNLSFKLNISCVHGQRVFEGAELLVMGNPENDPEEDDQEA